MSTTPTPQPTTTTPSTHPVLSTRQQQQTMGIDIRKALEILSARSQVSHHHHHHHHHNPSVGTGDSQQQQQQQCCGGDTVPDNTIGMGQTIDLLAPATTKDNESSTSSRIDDQEVLEEQRKLLEEERRKRRLEIQNELNAMSVRELLQQVMKAQQGRVATYRDYERYVSKEKETIESGNQFRLKIKLLWTRTTTYISLLHYPITVTD
jgi:hypothetical protein